MSLRLIHKCALSVALLLAAGCHADMTYRLEVQADNSIVVSIREVIDDQLYQLALGQSQNGDPFSIERSRDAGWSISRSTDDNGNHIIAMTKNVASNGQLSGLGNFSLPEIGGKEIPFNLSSFSIQKAVGLFFDRQNFAATMPALLPKSAEEQSDNPFAGAAAGMISSIISMHIELKTPGKLIETNGESKSDGSVRWNLSLQSPTDLRYDVETPDVVHIVATMCAGIALIIVFALFIRRRKSGFISEDRL